MNTTQQAIQRHDIDAPYFQNVYNKKVNELSKKETVFLLGRKFVLNELEIVLKGLPKGSKVLDIGCGTAHLTHWIKSKGFDIIGLEPSVEMRNFALTNFNDIKIVDGVGTNLPFANASFDFVVSFEVMRYLSKEENKRVYEEMFRVLKPNGQFFLTQVNTLSLDFYFFYYKILNLYKKISNQFYHYTYFTNSKAELETAKCVGFTNVYTIGIFSGSTRLFYKVSKSFGNFYWKLHSKYFKENSFKNSFLKNTKAHLIVIGSKPINEMNQGLNYL